MQNKLNILHLCSFFSGISAVYENAFEKIDDLGHTQLMYVPYRMIKMKKEMEFKCADSKIIWRPILNTITRLAYFYKKNKIYKDASQNLLLNKYDVIHAHTWFTDGGVAYEIYKKHRIPYVITVRSTDISTFVKYFYHIRPYGEEILKHANKIIFVSKAYEEKVHNMPFLKNSLKEIVKKSSVIPNGIDNYWINNSKPKKEETSNGIRLIYIGNFLRRKNVFNLIQAVNILADKSYDVHLDIVGGGREYSKKLLKTIQENKNINFIGNIKDKSNLAKLIRSNDIFTMPSYNETFGLVYVEALSQGVPVLYSKNEGIDGFYGNSIGEGVDHENIQEIADAILKIHTSYEDYNFNPKKIVEQHNWANIAVALCDIYKESKLGD